MAAIQAGERSRARTTVASTVELLAQGLPVQRKGERRNVDDDNGERQGRKEERERERERERAWNSTLRRERREKLGGWRKGGWVREPTTAACTWQSKEAINHEDNTSSPLSEPRCLGLEDCLRRKAKRKRRKRRDEHEGRGQAEGIRGAGERREGPGKK